MDLQARQDPKEIKVHRGRLAPLGAQGVLVV